jgi:hypothetical protein
MAPTPKKGQAQSSADPKLISAQIELSPKEAGRYYSEQSKSYGLQVAALCVNFLTLLAVALYTCFTYDTLRTTREADTTDATSHVVITNLRWRVQEENGTRKPIDQTCDDTGSGYMHFCFWMEYEAGGRTPASGMHRTMHVIPGADIDDAKAKAIVDRLSLARAYGAEGYAIMSEQHHEWGERASETICPKGCDLLPDEAAKMISREEPLYVYGAVQYMDMFGKQHATRFCFRQAKGGSCSAVGGCFSYCDFGNYLDRPGDVPK